jgi:hypothetical protein
MTASPVPFLKRRPKRRAHVRTTDRSSRRAWTFDGLHRVEIVVPDPDCAALLLEYASPLFPGEIVGGAPLIVRLQPPATGAGWVIELLAIVERWLETTPLPCAKLLYGGRSYLVRSSTDFAAWVGAGSAIAGAR